MNPTLEPNAPRHRILAVEEEADRITLRIAGEIVYTNETALGEEILRITGGRARVTLDLSAVDYVDSAGVALFVKLNRALFARGGGLTVTRVNPLVDSIFTMLSLRAMIEVR